MQNAQILAMLCTIAAIKMNRRSITVAELEKVYASGEHPEVNAEIDYILGK